MGLARCARRGQYRDGQLVSSFDELLIYIAMQAEPAQNVTLAILRDGKMQDVNVQLGVRPDGLGQ